jgi:signal transduction histidine kinase
MDDLEKEAQEISLMYGESAPQTIFTNKYNTRKLFLLDWPRLFQVLIILLDNSIKFSDGGAVQVTLTKT